MQLHCHLYRSQLRAMLSCHSRSATNSQKYVNNKFLSTSQKQTKIQNLKCRAYAAERKVQKLRERIDQITILNGVEISDPGFKDDLVTIMGSSDSEVKCAFPEGSFRRLFWEQQLKASSVTDSRQMRSCCLHQLITHLEPRVLSNYLQSALCVITPTYKVSISIL